MRYSLSLAALAASVVSASPALAQAASATAEARGVVVQPLTLAKVQDLDFGTVVGSAVAGTVNINADTGGRTVGGGVTGVPSFPGDRALFQGAGASGQDVILSLTVPPVLVNQSDVTKTITVNNMVLDSANSTTRTIDGTGVFTVGVGGTFAIKANQTPGLYKADFDLTADYQ